jgi:hypothetical protein
MLCNILVFCTMAWNDIKQWNRIRSHVGVISQLFLVQVVRDDVPVPFHHLLTLPAVYRMLAKGPALIKPLAL